jgi:hypothetical protein
MDQAQGLTTRWGKAQAWWQQAPGMDLDRWGVLTTLALYADEDGLCYPSQATIARALKRSRPWVNRVIGDLAEAGLIRKTSRTRASNGGTTSCEYRVITDPNDVVGVGDGVTRATPLRHRDDTPCHRGDTNQPEIKQNNPARPDARDLSEKQPLSDRADTEREPVPADWAPSADTMDKARAVSPDEDLEAHAVMFANRSRSKGYLFARGRVDQAWLAWLAEDRLKQHRKGRVDTPGLQRPGMGQPRDPGERRFAAWAAAADGPKLPMGAPTPRRPEGENPWR